MILAIPDHLVVDMLDMPTAIEILERASKATAAGQATFTERSNLMLPGGWMRLAPAALHDERIVGYKEFHLSPSTGIRFSIWLFDLDDGRPLALVDGKHITAMRTGASGGLAVDHLANPDAHRVAVIGSSDTAYRQLEATAAVRELDHVTVFSPTPANREQFAGRVREELGIEAVAVADVAHLTTDADILLISTDTKGAGPAVHASSLTAGLHVNSIGSTLPNQRELHHDVLERVDLLVVDTPGVLHDSGDLIAARDAGTVDPAAAVTLDDVVTGHHPGRGSADQITLYKSVGTAVQDVATAHHVYRVALDRGLGQHLPDLIAVKDD